MSRLDPGTEFAGYRVLARLGEGGMGQVFLVEHPHLLRREAMKVISVTAADHADFQERFTNEARTVALLRHPGIVAIHHYGVEAGAPWFTMTYLDGEDLSRSPLSDAEIGLVAVRSAEALDYAHRHQVIHRDIKPANIIVTREDDGVIDQVVLLDFGIARLMDSTRMTATQAFIGTLAYAGPELMDGLPAGPATDQYALACTIYELLTGVTPFEAPTPSAMMAALLSRPAPPLSGRRPDLASLDPVFARALSKDPALRYPDCQSFAAALSGVLGASDAGPQAAIAAPTPTRSASFRPAVPAEAARKSGDTTAPADTILPRPPTPSRLRRLLPALLTLVAAVLVAAVAVGVTLAVGRSDSTASDPVALTGQVTELSVDVFTTCAVRDAVGYCWGQNDDGQLGDGTTVDRHTPTRVAGISDVTDIATGGSTTCAVASRTLYCWGSPALQQTTVPKEVAGLTDVTDVDVDGSNICAIAGSSLYCWGANGSGQLGDGTTSPRTAPAKVESLSGVTAISVGDDVTCAVAANTPYCWGSNKNGQLGDGTTVDRHTPTQIKGVEYAPAISTGGTIGNATTCAVQVDDVAYCWGSNDQGQIGDGTTTARSTPTPVLTDALAVVTAAAEATCAITLTRELKCWGGVGIAGGDDTVRPASVPGLHDVTTLAVSGSNVCAVADAETYCWGLNSKGEVGDGTTQTRNAPTKVTFPA
ncbi:protein kinase [Gordonia sp. NB41Y]|uniref:protein kinase domain-containing protein n=1 Tax=Gordonia sp. NB41Y TaxID=875808 RepID=UPI0006B1EFD2|nr:protein kinase [Gordonia sp. NB41Y]EMP10673.2 serine/threonine protein kinase [Gordonia sp. NB41Y]WLP90302.1 protein kinase [Gordonia sp. NB41Y]